MADDTISAGQVSLSVVPNSAGFSEKIVSDLSDRLGYVGGVLGDTALGTLKKFAAPLAALAASLSVKKVVDDSIASFSDLAGSVKSLQRVVGGSTEEVSGLLGVMRMSGIDSDRAQTSLTLFSKALARAGQDAEKTAALTAAMSTEFLDASGNMKPMSEILPGLADHFKSMPDGAEKTALAVQLFGRQGTLMLPMLNKGAEGMAAMQARAKELGLTLDDTAMNAYSNSRKATRDFEAAIGGLQLTMGSVLLPVVDAAQNSFRTGLTPVIVALTGFIMDNRDKFYALADALNNIASVTGPMIVSFFTFMKDTIVTAFTSAKDAVIDFVNYMAPSFGDVIGQFKELGPVFKDMLPDLIELWQAFSPLSLIFQIIRPILPDLVMLLGTLTAALADIFANGLRDLLPAITDLVSQLAQGLVDALTVVMPYVQEFVQWLTENKDILIGVAGAVLAVMAAYQVVDFVRTVIDAWKMAQYGVSFAMIATTNASKIGWVANMIYTGAIFTSTGALWGAVTAAWAWTAALLANPITWIVIGIAALIAAIVLLAMNWDAVTAWITTVWNGFIGMLTDGWNWLYENAIKPVGDAIAAAFTWLWDTIIHPVISGILLYIGLWAALFTWLYEIAIKPTMDFIGAVFTWLYENIVVPIITGFGDMFTWLYENIIKPIGDGIGAVFKFIGDIIGMMVGQVNTTLGEFGAFFNWLYVNVIAPVGAWIGGIFEGIGSTVSDVFTNIGNFIRDTFNAIVGFVKGPVNAIISFINTMIDGLNSIKIKIPDWVPEWGGKTVGFNLAHIPQLADGGTITTGGTVMVGEAGPELLSLPKGASVTPLNGRDNKAVGNTIIYNAAPNVSLDSEQELFTAMRRAKVVAGW